MATMTDGRYSLMDRQELLDKLDQEDAFLLWNVQAEVGYKPEANIPGSSWVPEDQIRETIRRQKIAKTHEVVTYCAGPGCGASKEAAANLVAMGFKKVSAYEGGLEDWTGAGLPLTTVDD